MPPTALLRTVCLAGLLATFAWPVPLSAQDTGATPAVPSTPSGADGTLARASLGGIPEAPVLVGLGRWVLEPGATLELVVPGPELYAPESGVLSLRVEGAAEISPVDAGATPVAAAPAVATPGVDYTIRPGEQVLVPPGVPHTLRNDGDEPASVLNVVVFPAASVVPSWFGQPEFPRGVHFRTLVMDILPADGVLPAGPLDLRLTRQSVTPDTRLELGAVGWFDMLVVESGGLAVQGADPPVLTAGSFFRIDRDAPPAITNEGDQPAVVLRLTLESDQA